MKIEVEKKMTHGEFAKYMVDKFGISSFERNLADGEWFGAPSDRYNASINLKPAKYDDLAHSIRIDEDGVTLKIFEEITEDTKISILAHYSIYGFKGTKNCTSINDVKDDNSIAFYIMNDDRTMTLIWTREKGLVE